MLLSPEDGLTFVAVGAVAVVSATVACVLACCSAVLANLSASLSWALPPQAASVSAVAMSASRIGIFFMVMVGPPRPERPPRGEPCRGGPASKDTSLFRHPRLRRVQGDSVAGVGAVRDRRLGRPPADRSTLTPTMPGNVERSTPRDEKSPVFGESSSRADRPGAGPSTALAAAVRKPRQIRRRPRMAPSTLRLAAPGADTASRRRPATSRRGGGGTGSLRPTSKRNESMAGEGFEPSKAEPPDLQSGPFDRSGTPPGTRGAGK